MLWTFLVIDFKGFKLWNLLGCEFIQNLEIWGKNGDFSLFDNYFWRVLISIRGHGVYSYSLILEVGLWTGIWFFSFFICCVLSDFVLGWLVNPSMEIASHGFSEIRLVTLFHVRYFIIPKETKNSDLYMYVTLTRVCYFSLIFYFWYIGTGLQRFKLETIRILLQRLHHHTRCSIVVILAFIYEWDWTFYLYMFLSVV